MLERQISIDSFSGESPNVRNINMILNKVSSSKENISGFAEQAQQMHNSASGQQVVVDTSNLIIDQPSKERKENSLSIASSKKPSETSSDLSSS